MVSLYLYHLKNLNQKILDSQGSPQKLLQSGARNDLFYLEGLSRLDATCHKKMKKWLEKFKRGEDLLGKLDFYLWIMEEVKKRKIEPTQKKVLIKDAEQKLKEINKACNKYFFQKFGYHKWSDKLAKQIKRFNLKHDQNHLNNIKKSIILEMDELHNFLKERNYNFKLMEEDVHEFRRKIRWFSIYAWALRGKIELKIIKFFNASQKKYWITSDILKNPFVNLPKIKSEYKLYYNKEVFLALSGMIQKVGEWKDEGLFYEYLESMKKEKIKTNKHHNIILEKMNEMLKKYRADKLFLKKLVYF
jgi:inhibitor of KinA sporulation pathway (predicted exonuclease)